jgi:hypothetical protein
MEAGVGGSSTYGGRFWRWISIWRQVPGAVLIWRQFSEAVFNREAALFFTGAGFLRM